MNKKIFIELVKSLFLFGGILVLFYFGIQFLSEDKKVRWFASDSEFISYEKEIQLGDLIAEYIIEKDKKKRIQNQLIDSVVWVVSSHLQKELNLTEYDCKIQVIDSPEVNAFTLSGGRIYVNKGLLKFCDSAEQLAAVLAHEMGHVEKRHTISKLVKEFGLKIVFSVLGGDVLLLNELWETVLSSKFDRYQEKEADQFKSVLGNDVRFYETYNASEGFFAIQDRNDHNDMLLMLDYGIYFEFEVLDKQNPEIINLSEVKLDTNYAIIISTNAGLWRYKIGDTVKFTSLSPFRIKITGRTKSFINAFGEELIIENAENALNKTLLKHNSRIVEYTVAPSFISKNKSGFHQWMIEFEKAPANISKFCEDLDKNLQKFNSDYKSKRFKNITMKRLEIIVAKEKLFFDWLKFKNKLGGQNKIPRLCNDRIFIEELIKLN